MKILYVTVLSLLVSACGSDSSDTKGFIGCENRICSDQLGDTDFSFIDIGEVQVKTDNLNLVVDVSFLNFPESLVFNSANILDGFPQYSWSVSFDVARDNTYTDVIRLDVTYINDVNAPEVQGSPLNLTRKDVLQFEGPAGGGLIVGLTIGQVILTQNNNTLTFTVPKSVHPALEAINQTTPFNVYASYNSAGTEYEDKFPDYNGYIQ